VSVKRGGDDRILFYGMKERRDCEGKKWGKAGKGEMLEWYYVGVRIILFLVSTCIVLHVFLPH
jgi:hypothetical protein